MPDTIKGLRKVKKNLANFLTIAESLAEGIWNIDHLIYSWVSVSESTMVVSNCSVVSQIMVYRFVNTTLHSFWNSTEMWNLMIDLDLISSCRRIREMRTSHLILWRKSFKFVCFDSFVGDKVTIFLQMWYSYLTLLYAWYLIAYVPPWFRW